uniref:Uncharacterized protein n=1 Tax=Heliothis virescens TaxID=7102 RepID=A0A2A4JU05_HELVI
MQEFCGTLTPDILKPIIELHKHKSIVVPTPSEPHVPAPSEPDVPAPSEPDVPAPSEPDVPAPSEPDVPAPSEPDVPAPSEPDVPAPSEPHVPAAYKPDVPAPSEPDVPAPSDPDVPAPSEPDVPAPSEPDVPAAYKPDVPTPSEPHLPALLEPDVSAPSEPDVPAPSEPDVPAPSEPDILCKKDKRHCYSGETLNAVVDLVVSMCACSNKKISKDDSVTCKIENGSNGLNSEMTRKLDRMCEKIGEIYAKLEEIGSSKGESDDSNKPDSKVTVINDLHTINEVFDARKEVNGQTIGKKEKITDINQPTQTKVGTTVNQPTGNDDNISNNSPQDTIPNEEKNHTNKNTEIGNTVNTNVNNLDKSRKKHQHLSNKNKNTQLNNAQDFNEKIEDETRKNIVNNTAYILQNENFENKSDDTLQNKLNVKNSSTRKESTSPDTTILRPGIVKPADKKVNIGSRRADNPNADVKEAATQQFSLETVIAVSVCGFAYGTLLAIVVRMTYTRCTRQRYDGNHLRA